MLPLEAVKPAEVPVPAKLASDCLVLLAKEGGADALARMKDVVDDACLNPRLRLNAAEPDTGRTALHYAAMHGDEHMAQLLAKQRGIDLNVLDKQGYTPVAVALQSGSLHTVIRLLSTAFTNTHCNPIDLVLCGSDTPERSPMGVALAADSPDQLDCLLSLVALYESRTAPRRHSLSTGLLQRANSSSLSGSSGSNASMQSIRETMLRQAIDASGRSPLTVALQQDKLAHALVLLEAGAPLSATAASMSVSGEAQAGTAAASPSSPSTSQTLGTTSSGSSSSSSAPPVYATVKAMGSILPGSTTVHMAVWCLARAKAAAYAAPDGSAAAAAAAVSQAQAAEHLQLATRVLDHMLDHSDLPEVACQQDADGECSLHAAVRAGLVEAVGQLARRAPNTLSLLNRAGMSALEIARGDGGSKACAEMLQPFYVFGSGPTVLGGSWRMGSLLKSVSRNGSFRVYAGAGGPPSLTGKKGDSHSTEQQRVAHIVAVSGSAQLQTLAAPLPSNASSFGTPAQQEVRQLLKKKKAKGLAAAGSRAASVDTRGVSCLSFAMLTGRKKPGNASAGAAAP